jgi:DNA-binding CsgD family transcriptional regulator
VDIGWRAGEAFSRYLLGDCLAWRGRYGAALRLARESLAIAEELEHVEWQCGARRVLGAIALDLFAGPEALRQLEAAYTLARRLGSATWIRWTGAPFALALARLGDPARANVVLAEVAALVPARAGRESGEASSRATLGERYLSLARGEAALAAGEWEGALAAVAAADGAAAPRMALLRGEALAGMGRWDAALDALGAAREGAERQAARPLAWRIEAVRGRVLLGQRRRREARAAFDAARAHAAALVDGLEEGALLAGYADAVDRLAPPRPRQSPAQQAKEAFGGLTRRERDTAALIAQGKTNRAIARHLGIGERTVEGHVAAALAKLDCSSRAQLAVWAVDRGLAVPPESPGRRRR